MRIVLGHDGFLQFGGGFDVGDVLIVEVFEPVFDDRSHRHCFLDVLVLGLEDVDAVVDEGLAFELCTLFACGVLGEYQFGALEDVGMTVDGTECEVTEGAG